MRLFIAIELPDDVTAHLRTLQKQLKTANAKQTFPSAFHLTLKFLGEVSPQVADAVKASLSRLELKRFTAKLGGVGTFDRLSKPAVTWIALEPNDKLHELQTAVDDALTDEFPREQRFEPHVTLSRVKQITNADAFRAVVRDLPVKPLTFDVNAIHLVQSTLARSGPTYRTFHTVSFK